jgi:glycosyltransferase involved in cell wall biosynthesis
VVATPNVGALYVLDNGAAGVIVGLPDVGRTLIELLGNGARRDRMRAAGLARAREFALTSVVDQYEAIYRGGPELRRRQA